MSQASLTASIVELRLQLAASKLFKDPSALKIHSPYKAICPVPDGDVKIVNALIR
jgi:hypothetical protein